MQHSRRILRAFALCLLSALPVATNAAVLRVKSDAPGPEHDGTSWNTAFRTVHDGLAVAQSGDEMWVAKGVYHGWTTVPSGVALYGGFAGDETALEQRDWRANVTTLDADGWGKVVSLGREGIVDGFTIRNGTTGIFCEIGAATLVATVRNNTITSIFPAYGSGGTGVDIQRGNVALINNTITRNARGVLALNGNLILIGNTISANSGYGVLISNVFANSTATLTNNTISGNADDGVAVAGVTATLTNNIIAFNAGLGVSQGYSGTIQAFAHNDVYGNVEGDYSGLTDPTGMDGNLSKDPRLSNPYHDIHLQPDSPCVDAGDTTADGGTLDIDGQSRVQGTRVDIGSDESDGTAWPSLSRTWHISPNGDDAHDGLSWASARRTVNGALSLAQGDDELWVAKGVYPERITIPAGVALYGGFAGTETERGQRDISARESVLDGGGLGDVVTCREAGVVMDGFTIRNADDSPYNETGYYGARVWSGAMVLTHCIVTGCGTGVYVDVGTLTLSRSTVSGNESGVGIGETGKVALIGNTLSNSARNGVTVAGVAALAGNTISGSGLYGVRSSGRTTLTSNSISGNGTGLFITRTGTVLAGNTICGNSDTGVILSSNISVSSSLTNNIIAFNGGYGLAIGPNGSLDGISHNDVYANARGNYNGLTDPTGMDGNISKDPRLSNPYHDIRIQPDSPCRDAGDDAVVVPGEGDIECQPRIQGAHVDIGSDESDGTVWSDPSRIWHVSPSGDDANDGMTWRTAKQTISETLSMAQGSDEVWVSSGTYSEHLDIPPGVALYGGFSGTETRRDARLANVNLTVLDGGGTGCVVNCRFAGIVVDGFSIQNTGAKGTGVSIDRYGNTTLANSTVSGHSVGVSVYYGTATLTHNLITGNSSDGVYVVSGTSTLTDNVISGNAENGVDIISGTGKPTTLTGNTTCGNGGNGMAISGSIVATGAITNNIVVFNGSYGVAKWTNDFIALAHNNVYGNTTTNYVTIPDPTGTDGNLSADPLFVDRAAGNYRLQAGSPCIDTGDDSTYTPGDVDLDGNTRKMGAHIDIGAYEFLTAGAFTMSDARRALKIASGLEAATTPADTVDLPRALAILRKVTGLSPNP